jgi:hypothetical protein
VTKTTGYDFLSELKAVMTNDATKAHSEKAEPAESPSPVESQVDVSDAPAADAPATGMIVQFSWYIRISTGLQEVGNADSNQFQKATHKVGRTFLADESWRGDPVGTLLDCVDLLRQRDVTHLRSFLREITQEDLQGVRDLTALLNRTRRSLENSSVNLPLTPVSNLNKDVVTHGWDAPAGTFLRTAPVRELEILEKPMEGNSTTRKFLHIFLEFVQGCLGEMPEQAGIKTNTTV